MQLLLTTFACDNACAFCAQAALRALGRPAGLEEQLTALSEAEPVVLVGGEPLLHPDVTALVQRVSAGRSVGMQTNARRLATPPLAEQLKAAGLGWVEVALHGDRAALHDYHTQRSGSFEQSVAGLTRARLAGLELRISSVVTRSNYRHLPDMVDHFKGLGAQRLRLAAVAPEGEALAQAARLVPAPALVRPYLLEAQRRASSAGLPLELGLAPSAHFAGLGIVAAPGAPGWRRYQAPSATTPPPPGTTAAA